ncbi:DUF2189 domain-containing protein [Dongia soli]|uniref:DUF2189 domain-containing protein n=1 Tax=Dongia soli TaxID=600628 RepID=A0ABU5EFD8_9PROT|nr:DUF2189 domain-containing protein [Dongia soli]MDY0884933.1 DUF2189 domain-containing protein [Dongia soli]
MALTIRNPVEWGWDQILHAAEAMGLANRSLHRTTEHLYSAPPTIRHIHLADIREVLRKGFEDFGAYRTDVIFLCIVYPIAGLVFARMAFQYEMIPLIFPLASGFALIGPFAGVGLYEMSRRREISLKRGHEHHASWKHAFGVFRNPNFGAILTLGLMLTALLVVWLMTAWWIYQSINGPQPLESWGLFIQNVFTTEAGWWLIVAGCGVGFLFAALAMVISVISFPLMLDRSDIGLATAVGTSIRTVWKNPVVMAGWGLTVVAGLIIGSLPLFIGLVITLPVLGHATWHLYRKLIAPR